MDNRSLPGWWTSFRSYITLGSRSSSGYRSRSRPNVKKHNGAASETDLALDSKSNGRRQKLGRSDVTISKSHNVVHITSETTGPEHDDLEAQGNVPAHLKNNVKRGFGAG